MYFRINPKNTGFYSYSACFLNTLFLNMYVSMSYYRVYQAASAIRIPMAAPHEYVNTHSTRRVCALFKPDTSHHRIR